MSTPDMSQKKVGVTPKLLWGLSWDEYLYRKQKFTYRILLHASVTTEKVQVPGPQELVRWEGGSITLCWLSHSATVFHRYRNNFIVRRRWILTYIHTPTHTLIYTQSHLPISFSFHLCNLIIIKIVYRIVQALSQISGMADGAAGVAP